MTMSSGPTTSSLTTFVRHDDRRAARHPSGPIGAVLWLSLASILALLLAPARQASALSPAMPTRTLTPVPRTYDIDGDVLTDAAADRIYARGHLATGPATLLLDGAGRRLQSSAVAGALALDAGRGRLLVDNPAEGLHVLRTDGLQSLRVIPLPVATQPADQWATAPWPYAPQVDTRTGLAYVIRGRDVHIVSPASGALVGRLPDIGRSGGLVSRMLIDVAGRRLYVAQAPDEVEAGEIPDIPSSCAATDEVVTTLALPSHRVISRRSHCGRIGGWFANRGELVMSVEEYRGNAGMWRLRDGAMLRESDAWGPTRGMVHDAARHRFLVDGYADWDRQAGRAYWVDDRSLTPTAVMDVPDGSVAMFGQDDGARLLSTAKGALVQTPLAMLPPPPASGLPKVERVSNAYWQQIVPRAGSETWLIARVEVPADGPVSCIVKPGSLPADSRGAWAARRLDESAWQLLDASLACDPETTGQLALSPDFATDHTAFLTADSLLRTVDGGRSWQPVGGRQTWSMSRPVLSPTFASDGLAFSTTAEDQAVRTVDHGASWQPIGELASFTFAPDYPADRRIFAVRQTGSVFMQSLDSGRTWRRLGSPSTVAEGVLTYMTALQGGPSSRAVTLLGMMDSEYSGHLTFPTSRPSVVRSDDGGRTWQQALGPLETYGLDTLYPIHASSGDALLVAAWPTDMHADRFLLRSDDRGLSWRTIKFPSAVDPAQLVSTPDGLLFSLEEDGTLRRLDVDDATDGPPPTIQPEPTARP